MKLWLPEPTPQQPLVVICCHGIGRPQEYRSFLATEHHLRGILFLDNLIYCNSWARDVIIDCYSEVGQKTVAGEQPHVEGRHQETIDLATARFKLVKSSWVC